MARAAWSLAAQRARRGMIYPALWSTEVEQRIRAEARSLDTQTVPREVRMCTKCVMTSARPRIVFDEEGVCSACRYADRKHNGGIGWHHRAEQLHALLDRHRRSSGYDVIVPCSGGKDSSYVAHRLKHDFGMHPLCVKWAPFMETDIGRKNLDAFVHSGFDVVECRPNGLLHRKLARLALEYLGDPFDPFVYGQLAFPMQIAAKFNISLVMFGENGDLEYSGNTEAENKPRYDDADWERVYTKGAGLNALIAEGQRLGAFTADEVRSLSEFYRLPVYDFGPVKVRADKPEFHWFGYYEPWHPMRNFYYAAEHCGFTPNPERSEGTYTKMSSLDDKLDGAHYWFGWLKHGIGRCTSDAAQQTRNGDIDRDEALALVARYDGEFPRKYYSEGLEYLGMDDAQFCRVAEGFCREGLDWRAKMEVGRRAVLGERAA